MDRYGPCKSLKLGDFVDSINIHMRTTGMPRFKLVCHTLCRSLRHFLRRTCRSLPINYDAQIAQVHATLASMTLGRRSRDPPALPLPHSPTHTRDANALRGKGPLIENGVGCGHGRDGWMELWDTLPPRSIASALVRGSSPSTAARMFGRSQLCHPAPHPPDEDRTTPDPCRAR